MLVSRRPLAALAAALLVTLPGCGAERGGPVRIVAIGPAPVVTNPNRDSLSPAAGLLLGAVAQGLVRFDAAGEIEPALAQSWIVSDDGRRYTFRLRSAMWARGQPVTAAQVVARLQAAISRPSRNPLKPVLGVIDEVEAMTDRVLEIRLRAPRPDFLQLLAQPEAAILLNGEGTGPYRLGGGIANGLRLVPPPSDEEIAAAPAPDLHLMGAEPAMAVAAFMAEGAELVTGGTLGELPLLAAADLPGGRLLFDPSEGLFGLAFVSQAGPLADSRVRQALSAAIDRDAIAARFPDARLQPRLSLLPPGIEGLAPTQPDWAGAPLAARREAAARLVADVTEGAALSLRVAMPDAPGYRILFAHLRRDWRSIGVEAQRVAPGAPADLRLVDEVAPAFLASWYLRHFSCDAWPVCEAAVAPFLDAARAAATVPERGPMLAQADKLTVASGIFIPIGAPIRWSLRSQRLNGLRPNRFARHSLAELIQSRN